MATMFDEQLISEIADSVVRLQDKENIAVPLLKKQLAEIEKGIENVLNAIQQGLLSSSTKKRLDELEQQKEELEANIAHEEIMQCVLTRDQIMFWLMRMKNLNLTLPEHKRRLVDTFLNSVYLFEDENKAVITFNCREGANTIALSNDGGSDIKRLGEPQNHRAICGSFVLSTQSRR